MILSSVNLIKNSHSHNNNHQFSDFILGKIREDQDRKDRKSLGTAPYGSKYGKQKKKEEKDCIFDYSSPEQTVTEEKPMPPLNGKTSTVTIETSDRYFFTVRLGRDTLYLADTESSAQTCVFRQTIFENTEQKQQLAVFQTISDSSKYITTDGERKLSISVFDTDPDPENPDDRFFVLHHVQNGSIFVQPYSHKGYYIHHIDNCLSVRKLEINLRPPEEYFFWTTEVEIPDVVKTAISQNESVKNIRNELVPPHNRSRIIIQEERPVKKPSLFFGCFGVKSRKIGSGKQSKVHR